MDKPEVVPFALLVLAVFGLLITPFGNAVSRRYEAEADWSALRATRDPRSAEGVFRKFTLYDVSGGALWVGSIVTAGYFFGGIPWVKEHLDKIIWAMILIPGLVILFGAWKARRKAMRAA